MSSVVAGAAKFPIKRAASWHRKRCAGCNAWADAAILNRAMLYTAITRASHAVVICGEIAAIRAAVARDSTTRQTRLARRLIAQGRSLTSAAYVAVDTRDACRR
jgi:hypothetical protein